MEISKEDSKNVSKESGHMFQYLSAIIVNFGPFTYGMMVGWPSPMGARLSSENTPVGTSRMSDDGISWLTAGLCLGGTFTVPFLGLLAEKLGRKKLGYLISLPLALSWLLMIIANTHTYLYIARVLSGIGGAGAMFLAPLYVSEIASDAIRGNLGSLMVFFINLGILLTFVVGPFLSFRMFATCMLTFPLIFLTGFAFMPETPVYLVRKSRLHEARKSLLWLKNNNKALVDAELEHLCQQAKEATSKLDVGWRMLYQHKATLRGLIISIGLLVGQQLCGIFAMVSYASTIFKMAGSSLSPDKAAIIIGAIQALGSFLPPVLMERAGRRVLLLVSCFGMAACHWTVGLFCYFEKLGYDVTFVNFIPVVALSMYMITYTLGMGPAPFVVMSEVFLPEIASRALSISLALLWFLAFVVVKLFAPLIDIMGIDGCFFLLGFFCACSFIFTLLLVPETKGRKLQDIVAELGGVKTMVFQENTYVIDKNFAKEEIRDTEVV